MTVEYLFMLKYKRYDNIDENFLIDFDAFVDVSVKFKDRIFFYVKKKDSIIAQFILEMIRKYKCEMKIMQDVNEYNILKYNLFKIFSKSYPEIVLDTDFGNMIVVEIELRNNFKK